MINIAHNTINSMQPSFFSELFNTKVRYSGISIGSQFGAVRGGEFTPLIATSLARYDGGHWTLVALYVTAASDGHSINRILPEITARSPC